MTYKEYLTKTLSKFRLTEDDIDVILADQASLIPDPDAAVNAVTAKTAICKEVAALLPLCNITEGGYSVSWNWDALKLWYSSLCSELGIDDSTKPKVRGRSNLW